MLKTSDFDYALPREQIAQRPLRRRDGSRLLVIDRRESHLQHRRFPDIVDYVRPGDVLVANDSRVIPARLHGVKAASGGKVELLLLEQLDERRWLALAGGKRLNLGTQIQLHDKQGRSSNLSAEITGEMDGPQRQVTFSEPIGEALERFGRTPLPPYIHEQLDDPDRYQTVYARPPGSAAAPTAGLHFTPKLLLSLREIGVPLITVTLHVGLDTFKPVEADLAGDHVLHSEWARLTPEAAQRINEAKMADGRIIAVGTTAVRVLETAALRSAGITGTLSRMSHLDAAGKNADNPPDALAAFEGRTDLFIFPGYRYRVVDAMLTNFHLPRSSLLMLVSAFAGRDRVLESYTIAVADGYRFYSFGDAMLIL
jgi:S-adenosylmethionine:tRNA ribosyltransferase-isomerase